MGCGDPREKIENEMLKMKMERTVIRMERKNQLKLLKDIDGIDLKIPKIPDYISESSNTNQDTKRKKRNETESGKKQIKKLKLRKSKSLNPKKFKTIHDDNYEGTKKSILKRKKTCKV